MEGPKYTEGFRVIYIRHDGKESNGTIVKSYKNYDGKYSYTIDDNIDGTTVGSASEESILRIIGGSKRSNKKHKSRRRRSNRRKSHKRRKTSKKT
jgi:ribosomal protein S6E (S10)